MKVFSDGSSGSVSAERSPPSPPSPFPSSSPYYVYPVSPPPYAPPPASPARGEGAERMKGAPWPLPFYPHPQFARQPAPAGDGAEVVEERVPLPWPMPLYGGPFSLHPPLSTPAQPPIPENEKKPPGPQFFGNDFSRYYGFPPWYNPWGYPPFGYPPMPFAQDPYNQEPRSAHHDACSEALLSVGGGGIQGGSAPSRDVQACTSEDAEAAPAAAAEAAGQGEGGEAAADGVASETGGGERKDGETSKAPRLEGLKEASSSAHGREKASMWGTTSLIEEKDEEIKEIEKVKVEEEMKEEVKGGAEKELFCPKEKKEIPAAHAGVAGDNAGSVDTSVSSLPLKGNSEGQRAGACVDISKMVEQGAGAGASGDMSEAGVVTVEDAVKDELVEREGPGPGARAKGDPCGEREENVSPGGASSVAETSQVPEDEEKSRSKPGSSDATATAEASVPKGLGIGGENQHIAVEVAASEPHLPQAEEEEQLSAPAVDSVIESHYEVSSPSASASPHISLPSSPRGRTYPPEGESLSDSAASARIQSAWRAHSVRSAQPLLLLRRLKRIADKAAALEADMQALLASSAAKEEGHISAREKLRLAEAVMALLLEVDGVGHCPPALEGVRQRRRELARRLSALQERVDALGLEEETKPVPALAPVPPTSGPAGPTGADPAPAAAPARAPAPAPSPDPAPVPTPASPPAPAAGPGQSETVEDSPAGTSERSLQQMEGKGGAGVDSSQGKCKESRGKEAGVRVKEVEVEGGKEEEKGSWRLMHVPGNPGSLVLMWVPEVEEEDAWRRRVEAEGEEKAKARASEQRKGDVKGQARTGEKEKVHAAAAEGGHSPRGSESPGSRGSPSGLRRGFLNGAPKAKAQAPKAGAGGESKKSSGQLAEENHWLRGQLRAQREAQEATNQLLWQLLERVGGLERKLQEQQNQQGQQQQQQQQQGLKIRKQMQGMGCQQNQQKLQENQRERAKQGPAQKMIFSGKGVEDVLGVLQRLSEEGQRGDGQGPVQYLLVPSADGSQLVLVPKTLSAEEDSQGQVECKGHSWKPSMVSPWAHPGCAGGGCVSPPVSALWEEEPRGRSVTLRPSSPSSSSCSCSASSSCGAAKCPLSCFPEEMAGRQVSSAPVEDLGPVWAHLASAPHPVEVMHSPASRYERGGKGCIPLDMSDVPTIFVTGM